MPLVARTHAIATDSFHNETTIYQDVSKGPYHVSFGIACRRLNTSLWWQDRVMGSGEVNQGNINLVGFFSMLSSISLVTYFTWWVVERPRWKVLAWYIGSLDLLRTVYDTPGLGSFGGLEI